VVVAYSALMAGPVGSNHVERHILRVTNSSVFSGPAVGAMFPAACTRMSFVIWTCATGWKTGDGLFNNAMNYLVIVNFYSKGGRAQQKANCETHNRYYFHLFSFYLTPDNIILKFSN
jgi:hypothetical protein